MKIARKDILKKIGKFAISKLQYVIPETFLIRYSQNVLVKNNKSILTSIVRDYFSERYKHASPEKKKQLGLMLWSSDAAIHYFKDRTYSEETVNQFLSVIRQYDGFDVCEIGTGNGKLIAEMAGHFQDRNFTGIDLNSEQIQINKNVYQKGNLNFIQADILEYLKIPTNKPTLFISYVSLTTFTPDMTLELFRLIKERETNSVIVLFEPIDSNSPDSDSSIPRSGLAYAHNYLTIAKQAGFAIVEHVIAKPFLWLVCRILLIIIDPSADSVI